MAGLHFVQGVAMLLLTQTISKTYELTGNYLSFDTATKSLVTKTGEVGITLNLAYIVVSFLFLSSLFHLIIATVYNKKYNSDLKLGMNKMRWIEYSLSASVMMVGIALLVGVYDLSSLIMMFTLVGVMNLCGLVMEIHNQTTEKPSWISYVVGCIAAVVPWLVVVIYFMMADANAVGDARTPSFVYWIFVSIFLFFNLFAVNMVLQYKKIGKWKDYIYGERVYIVLSLVAKSLLAWQVFVGALQP